MESILQYRFGANEGDSTLLRTELATELETEEYWALFKTNLIIRRNFS